MGRMMSYSRIQSVKFQTLEYLQADYPYAVIKNIDVVYIGMNLLRRL